MESNDHVRERELALTKDIKERDKEIDGLKSQIFNQEQVLRAMRVNGGRHWFVYSHQRDANAGVPDSPQKWQGICKLCGMDQGHPQHFAQGSRFLDSRDVETALVAVQDRLAGFLVSGLNMGRETAQQTVEEILADLRRTVW